MYRLVVPRYLSIFLFAILLVSTTYSSCHEQVVILGSGPAGLTAAIYTARAGLKTLVVEGNEPGGQISLSYEVENFPGFPEGISGYELGKRMREQAIRFGANIISNHVVAVDLSQSPFILTFEDGKYLLTETLIITSGASAKWLGVKSEASFIGKGVSSCATCDAYYYKGKEVVVVGGGDTALEDALFIANYASKITLIHRRDIFRGTPYLQKKVLNHPKIHIIWNSVVDEIAGPAKGKINGVYIVNLTNNQRSFYPCAGVFVAIGHKPNSDSFQDQLELSDDGHIKVLSGTTHTSVPGVFAAGDIVDAKYRQAITAAGTGCMAGIDAYHFINHKESQ